MDWASVLFEMWEAQMTHLDQLAEEYATEQHTHFGHCSLSCIRDSFKAGYLAAQTRITQLEKELAKWKDEYQNVCKFANQYEGELADARAEIDRLTRQLEIAKSGLQRMQYKSCLAEIATIEAEKERHE